MDDSKLRKDLQEYIVTLEGMVAIPIPTTLVGTAAGTELKAIDETFQEVIDSLRSILDNNP